MENYLLIDIYLLTQPLLSVSLVFAYTVLGPEDTAENKTDNDRSLCPGVPCRCNSAWSSALQTRPSTRSPVQTTHVLREQREPEWGRDFPGQSQDMQAAVPPLLPHLVPTLEDVSPSYSSEHTCSCLQAAIWSSNPTTSYVGRASPCRALY